MNSFFSHAFNHASHMKDHRDRNFFRAGLAVVAASTKNFIVLSTDAFDFILFLSGELKIPGSKHGPILVK
jgi:hypothetical protein